MKLTKEQIEAAKTARGGYRLAQLMALGYRPPLPGQFPPKGWKRRLPEREITVDQYAEFVRLGQGSKKKSESALKAHTKKGHRSDEPDLFHKPEQKETADSDQSARDYANQQWENNRESFDGYPLSAQATANTATAPPQ